MKRLFSIFFLFSFLAWWFVPLLAADEEHHHGGSAEHHHGLSTQPQKPATSPLQQAQPQQPSPPQGHDHGAGHDHDSTANLNELQARGKKLVNDLHCAGCHLIELGYSHVGHMINFPELYFEGDKIQASWLFSFLKQPYSLRPGIQQRMPHFRLSDEEALAITEYILALKDPKATLPEGLKSTGLLSQENVEVGKLLASPEYLACFRCHQQGDKKPEGNPEEWAPDLSLARQRLNPDWITRWLLDPQKIQPGTKMPTYFADDKSGPEDILGGDETKQIIALRDYILSLGKEQTDTYAQAKKQFPQLTPEKGRTLIANLNCTGCHKIGGFPPDIVPNGPYLLGIKAFVPDEAWLANYLLNPSYLQTYPTGYKARLGARHPGFRFSKDEAKAVAAYLMTLPTASKEELEAAGVQADHGDHGAHGTQEDQGNASLKQSPDEKQEQKSDEEHSQPDGREHGHKDHKH
jgi:mono/diheme cytochrome c family protein